MTSDENNVAIAEPESLRPLRDMILLLPHINARAVGKEYVLDWESAEPDLVRQIGRNAEITMRTVNRGLAAIGRLMVNISPEMALGEIPADTIEAIGWLISETSDAGATAHAIYASCQRYTADYSPPAPKHFPTTKP
ncbi:MAG: hypothetical protein IPN64_00280 [Propionivibrio sp.]|uniref:hypothetical protein n=1 Tax=Propionivibrio sp. TaxID=2212460 RepID=UPI0025D849B8|nr:hypothetical protein [Propionivibrio sp.]MBK8892532.1 hypothetical protein [Propionivibrio sp.]